jgi:hypothetical protein
VLAGLLELVADVVDGQVVFPQGDDPLTDGILLGLGLGTPDDIPEELPIHFVAEPKDENSKGTWLVAETASDLARGKVLNEVGSKGLVLPVSGMVRFEEEGVFEVCYLIWYPSHIIYYT